MMIPIYGSTETAFSGLGKGVLTEILNDEVHEVLNGLFEMTFQYPVTGRLIDELYNGAIVRAKPNDLTDPQPFRIYRISKAINGVVTVYARHVYYDLKTYVCEPFFTGTDVSWADAAPLIQSHIFPECPFSFYADQTTDAPRWDLQVPTAVWDMLTAGKGFLKEDDGIELEPNGFSMGLMKSRGADRGVTIRYGRNLRDITAETENEGWINGIYPYMYDPDGALIQLPERYLTIELLPGVPGQIKPVQVEPVLSHENVLSTWGSYEAYLRWYAETEAAACSLDTGTRKTIDIDYVQLSKTEEYKNHPLPDGIAMGDTVGVVFHRIDVSLTARATEIRYQPSTGLYKKVVLGEPKRNVLRTLAKR